MEFDAVGGILGLGDDYRSSFDYKVYEVPENNIEKLIRFEQDIINHQKKTLDSMFSMAKTLFNARDLLANNKVGTFGAWHESLGLNREAVSVLLKRYDLYLQVKDKEVMQLPVRAVKVITKAESKFSKEQIKEILKSEKPLAKIQDIVRLSDNIVPQEQIEEAELVDEIIDAEIIAKDFAAIKKLLAKVELKLSVEAKKTQQEKLKRIQEILKDL